MVKNLPTNAVATRDMGSIPGLGGSPGGGNGNPLQYSCLENAMDSGAWQATVHRVVKVEKEGNRPTAGERLLQAEGWLRARSCPREELGVLRNPKRVPWG